MYLFEALRWCSVLVAFVAVGEAPDAARRNRSLEELRESLASGQPRKIAWAAYDAARQNRRELVPDLISLISTYQRGSIKNAIVVPPEDAAIEAVTDALIQLDATAPGVQLCISIRNFRQQR